MKKILILSFFAIVFLSAPIKADALLFDDIDRPHCLFTDCDNDEPARRIINNTTNTTNTTNSNNTNSNINSPVTYNTPGYDYDDDYDYDDYDRLTASCYSNPTSGEVGDRIY